MFSWYKFNLGIQSITEPCLGVKINACKFTGNER